MKRQAELARQIARLTDALANGDDSRALREGIKTREAEAARLERELARMAKGTAPRSPEAAVQALEGCCRSGPPRGAAPHAPQARQMLRKLLQGRLVFTPEDRNEQPGYRVRGAASVEPLLNVVLKVDSAHAVDSRLRSDPRTAPENWGNAHTVASLMPASWNQIVTWLQQIDGLRRAA